MTALGLFVGILAVWLHNHLSRRMELFDSEMFEAEANILVALKGHSRWRDGRYHSAENSRWAFLTVETPQWEISYDRQHLLLMEVWGYGIFLAVVLLLRSC
jgi:hypothetical protein